MVKFEVKQMRGGWSVFKVTENGRRIFANAFDTAQEAQEAYPLAVLVPFAGVDWSKVPETLNPDEIPNFIKDDD